MDRLPPNVSHAIRRFRNVACALSLMACCAFLSFWGRSGQHVDRASVRVADDRSWPIVSRPGRLQFYSTRPPSASMWPSVVANGWGLSSHPIELTSASLLSPAWSRWGFTYDSSGTAWWFGFPFWCPIVMTATLCVLFKPSPRFRLGISTLLILFVCVALVLGMFTMLDNAAAYERRTLLEIPGTR